MDRFRLFEAVAIGYAEVSTADGSIITASASASATSILSYITILKLKKYLQ